MSENGRELIEQLQGYLAGLGIGSYWHSDNDTSIDDGVVHVFNGHDGVSVRLGWISDLVLGWYGSGMKLSTGGSGVIRSTMDEEIDELEGALYRAKRAAEVLDAITVWASEHRKELESLNGH